MARVFEALIEQIQQTAATWEPVNENGDVTANEVRQMIVDAPEVFEALAQMWTQMAGKSTDQVWLDSGAADVLTGAAAYCRAPVDHLQEVAATVDRAHAANIEGFQLPATANAWNWDRNQGYSV